jgi:hypothetical protein
MKAQVEHVGHKQCGTFVSTDSLKAAIQAYIVQTNLDPKPFIWTKSADAILASVGRFCQKTSSGLSGLK